MTYTQTKPELPGNRVAGYKAMANVVVSMWEVPDYYDPAGQDDFRESVNRLVPCKPGFLQLATWFLAKHGPISLGRSRKTGEIIMDDEKQKMEWRSFAMEHGERRMPVHSRRTYYFNEDQTEDRVDHVTELVEGEQYCFKYRAEDIEIGVKYSGKLTYTVKEFMPDGTVQYREGKGGF